MSDDAIPERIGDYVFGDRLGHGGFASVYKGTHEPTKKMVAIKVMKKSRVAWEKLEREILLMKSMDHPFIAAFYEYLEDDQHHYMVIEMCENGNCFELVSRSKKLPSRVVRRVLAQLVCGLEYIHTKIGAAHRDIKLENIMFDKCNNVRIIDFGLGNIVSGEGMLQTACGSPAYAAPEILRHEPYTVEADIWALGVVTYAMTYGKLPWWNKNLQLLAESIVMDDTVYTDEASIELICLLKKMLLKEYSFRITLDGIRKSPFMVGDPLMMLLDGDFHEMWKGKEDETVSEKIERRWAMEGKLQQAMQAMQAGISLKGGTPMRRGSNVMRALASSVAVGDRNVRSMVRPAKGPVPLPTSSTNMQRAGVAVLARHRVVMRERSSSVTSRVLEDNSMLSP